MQEAPSERTRHFLTAVLPIGVVLLVAWIVHTLAAIAVGADLSLVSSILGLITSLILIVTGIGYRRALRREEAVAALRFRPSGGQVRIQRRIARTGDR